jgi:small conductance mechanosensitive channel
MTKLIARLLPEALTPYALQISHAVLGLAIFIIGWIVAKLLGRVALKALRARKVDEGLARFLSRGVVIALLITTVITSLGMVGLRTTSLIALLGSAGLAIGLALQGSLAHFAAGVLLLFFRPFTIGDWITVAGQTGQVADVGLFATSLVTAGNEKVVVPNAKITADAITNVTVLGLRRACVDIGVPYATDLEQAKTVLGESAARVDKISADHAPTATLANVAGGTFTLTTCVWCRPEDHGDVMAALREVTYSGLVAAEIEVK